MKKFKLFLFSAIVAFVITAICDYQKTDTSYLQKGISKKIIRFRVIANSDSEEDQIIKLKVKDAVVSYIKPFLCKSKSIENSLDIISEHEEELKQIALKVINENGYNYSIETGVENRFFPVKQYGNFAFPAGNYRAYEIRIGNSEGKNWWCVLYPPLCFIDACHGVVDENGNEILEDILTTDEYNAVCGKGKVVYRFRILKFLNKFL